MVTAQLVHHPVRVVVRTDLSTIVEDLLLTWLLNNTWMTDMVPIRSKLIDPHLVTMDPRGTIDLLSMP